MNKITFVKAKNQVNRNSHAIDPKVLCYGLGATDPKGIFNNTWVYKNLGKSFTCLRLKMPRPVLE